MTFNPSLMHPDGTSTETAGPVYARGLFGVGAGLCILGSALAWSDWYPGVDPYVSTSLLSFVLLLLVSIGCWVAARRHLLGALAVFAVAAVAAMTLAAWVKGEGIETHFVPVLTLLCLYLALQGSPRLTVAVTAASCLAILLLGGQSAWGLPWGLPVKVLLVHTVMQVASVAAVSGLGLVMARRLARTAAINEELRKRAERASAAKSSFLATMSHEIRTPLNGIIGLTALASDPQTPAAERAQVMGLLNETARSLTELVSDVLDMARIESGALELRPEPIELSALARRLTAIFEPMARNKGIELRAQCDESIPAWVVADPLRLRQVATNYLSNALKFTAQGSITIRFRRVQPNLLRLEVQDTGAGIPSPDLEGLFAPFVQGTEASPADQPSQRGTGLGLAICRELAGLMQGRVGAVSQLGQGSLFWLEWPLAEASQPLDRAHAGSKLDAQDLPLTGLRVLLVDDNRVNLFAAQRLLQRAGAEVETATDGIAGLELALERSNSQPFDVALIDVQMPGMDGLDLARALRADPSTAGLRIIGASAAVLKEDVEQAITAGMDDFVGKPFDWPRLQRVLARHSPDRGL